jgi:hypothetical protein
MNSVTVVLGLHHKTWVEMYGCPDGCVVDGEYISHKTGNSYKVVRRLMDEKQAKECLEAWQKEWEVCKKANILPPA